MADRYWVGGSGTWDATTTTNWATSTGGAGGASAPTSADNVIFDSLSNATLYTVTVGTNAVCNDLTAAGPLVGNVTFSLGATAVINCHGSMTLPATGLTWTPTTGANLNFLTTGSSTLTTNGVSLGATSIEIIGTGTVTLGSALTLTSTLSVTTGTFTTANFNITAVNIAFSTTNVKAVNLGSSTITLSGATAVNNSGSNLTLNAGTSQITCSNASPTFAGGGLTFYNVSFTSAANGTTTITGANTFNNLTQTSRSATGVRGFSIGANQTVSGTLTLGAANQSVRRIQIQSNTIGTQRTITLNGSLATLADCDFRNVATAGSVGTWTGTRLGNGLGNSGITFTAAKDVYWNLAAGTVTAGTVWALTSGGAPDANNFPLAQDRAIIENTGLNSGATVTFSAVSFWYGELDTSTRTLPMTFANAVIQTFFYKNVTLSSAVTMTGTGAWNFNGQGTTQILDVNTATFVPPITIESPSGILQLAENTTCSATVTLTSGTLNLNNNVLTANAFSSSNTNTRVIAFGTGNITLTGNAATIWTTAIATNFSYTGTPTVNCTYSGSTGTRTITASNSAGGTESNALNFNISAGSDIVTGSSQFKNLNFTGFTGTLGNASNIIYGNLTLVSGMTLTAGTVATTFSGTSGTQQITTANLTLDFPLTFDGIGGTFAFQDALTQGSTRAFTVTNGTVQLKNGVTSTVGAFATSGTNQKFLQSTTPGLQATISQASGTVNASYLTIQDINAVGGAEWDAFVNQQNIDASNNDGWDFGISPIVGSYEYTYQLRSFTQPRRF